MFKRSLFMIFNSALIFIELSEKCDYTNFTKFLIANSFKKNSFIVELAKLNSICEFIC